MKHSFGKIIVWVLFLGFALSQYSCTVGPKKVSAKSSAETKASSPAEKAPPPGNSALHYIDSRLHKLQEHDAEALKALRRATEMDAASPYLHAEMARHLAETEQYEQATLEAEKALELDEENPNFHLLRGKLFSVKKQSDLALAAYETCIKIDREMEECYTMMAREHLLQKDPDAALRVLARLFRLDPNSSAGQYFAATIYAKHKENTPRAIELYKKVLEEDPEHYKSLTALAQIYLNQKDYPKALENFLKLEQLAPRDIPTQLRIGLLYYELKNYKQAISRFSNILELSPENERVYYYLGILETQDKNFQRAGEYFQKVPSDSSFYKDAIIRQVLVLEENNQTAEAVKVTKSAIKKRKDIPDLYELLANLYLKQNQNAKALKSLDQGLRHTPNDEKLLFSKGVLLDKLGKFNESMEVMKAILAQDPDNALALNYVGYSYADRGIRLQEALEMLLKADRLKPNDGYITDSLGWAYFKLGQVEKALELLKKANQLVPEEPTVLEHLGDIHLKMGQKEKAKQYFKEAVTAAVKLGPQDPRDQEDLKRIKEKLSALTH